MKTVFITIPMKNPAFVQPLHYPVDGNADIEYSGKVAFPVNGVLARILQENEHIRIVQILNVEKDNPEKAKTTENSLANAQKFKDEFENIAKEKNVTADFISIEEPFAEDKKTYEKRFRKIIGTFEDDMQIIADITFGQKSLPLVLFSAMSFAEKFFNAEILHIIYAQISYDDGNKQIEGTQKICDFSPLYYLNGLTAAMEAPNGKTAVKMIGNFFEM